MSWGCWCFALRASQAAYVYTYIPFLKIHADKFHVLMYGVRVVCAKSRTYSQAVWFWRTLMAWNGPKRKKNAVSLSHERKMIEKKKTNTVNVLALICLFIIVCMHWHVNVVLYYIAVQVKVFAEEERPDYHRSGCVFSIGRNNIIAALNKSLHL